MVHIYEKICKTKENQYGIIERNDNNIFKSPCIITIIAGPIFLKNINYSKNTFTKNLYTCIIGLALNEKFEPTPFFCQIFGK